MKRKRIFGIIITLMIIVGVCVKILYVNFVEYKQEKITKYNYDQEFSFEGMDIIVAKGQVLDKQQIKEKYSEEAAEYADDNNIIIDVIVKNNGEKENSINLSGIALIYDGVISGGNMNPFLWGYLNDCGATITLAAGESKTISATFPYEDKYSKVDMIFNLFPEKIAVEVY